MARCQEMSTLPAGYITQHKVPSASSSGSLGITVCVKCFRIVDSVPIRHTISILKPIQSDHLSISQTDDTAFGAGTFSWQNPVHSWKGGPGECMTWVGKKTSIKAIDVKNCLNRKNHLENYIKPKLNGNLFRNFLKSESWDMTAVLMMQVGQVAKPTSWDSQGHIGQLMCNSRKNFYGFFLPSALQI